MPALADRFCWRSWSRLAVLGVLAAAIAGCSADTTRFGNANPYASRTAAPSEMTGSTGAPTSRIASQPLPPPAASHPATIASSGVSGGGPGLGSYTPARAPYLAPPPARDITGSVPHPPRVAAANAANVHVVGRGETLMSLSRHYHKPLAQIAAANKLAPSTRLKIGDRIVIPGVSVAARPVRPTLAAAAPRIQPPPPAPAPLGGLKVADASPTARIAATGTQATAEAGAKTTANTGAPSFRWPVRGRVITGFGPKTNGQQSDGIDLAVPEGTAVRAAEDGVVAYAGNELKGYGNLILIRHADGFVTAYAHASEIMVKRNDTVRRGQVIAKSGETGNVTSPQLHFEIRKGSSPVDPTQYLPSGA